MSLLYRLIPLRVLRRTSGVKFDEIVPSDLPQISGIDRVIHKPNSISPPNNIREIKTKIVVNDVIKVLDNV